VKTSVAIIGFAFVVGLVASRASAQQIFAQTGFNDQSGINSDPAPGSPYTIGQTIGGRGAGEPGWGEAWRVLNGGAEGGDPDAIARATSAFEGDGGVALTRGNLGSTVISRRLAQGITGRFVVETRVNFGSVGDLIGIPLEINYPLRVDRNGPMWGITGPVGARHFQVFDGQSNQLGEWEDTGIEQRPGEWQNVVIDANVVTQRFTFSVDGVTYNAPDPLGFNDAAAQINGLAYFTTGSGSIDAVIVRAVPEPVCCVAGGMLSLLLVRRRRRS
jgi:hypothetical protein